MIQAKLLRIAQGIPSYRFAAMVGYNPQLWSKVEKGERQPPIEIAERAADLLGKSVEEIMREV